jgi:hypothetical protein
MNRRRWLSNKEWCYIALALLAIFAFPLPAFSQSCALCYTQAASAGQKMIQALRSGILILVIPPTLGSIGMLFVLRQKGKQVRRTDQPDEPFSEW